MTCGDWLCTNVDVVGITDMHQTKFRGENFFGCGVPQARRGSATAPQLVST